jgi:DNA-binding MltR family transcriptional regulator
MTDMNSVNRIDLEAEIAELKARSQAGTVLVAAAALDGVLRNLLLLVMRGLSNNKAEQIFGSHGPLYHLSPKIEIAYAFKVIDEDVYSDLRIIKDIRNKFAHPEGPTDFRTPKVMELVRGFNSWTSGSDGYDLFVQQVKHCWSQLDAIANRALYVQALAPDEK